MLLQVRHPDQKAKQNHATFIEERKQKNIKIKKPQLDYKEKQVS